MKPFKTIEEQIDILRDRNLTIEDTKYAASKLESLNCYRLSGYSLTLRKNNRFYTGSSFEDVMDIYECDRELRSLIWSYVANIEISLRTHIGYVVGVHDPSGLTNPEMFRDEDLFERFQSNLKSGISNNSTEDFVRHHIRKYNGMMPCWVMVELLSFGDLSTLFTGLSKDIKKEIIEKYYPGCRFDYLENWLEGVVILRNFCAHHKRLYNRGLPLTPKFTEENLNKFRNAGYNEQEIGKRLFFRVVILCRLLDTEQDMTRFLDEMEEIFNRHQSVRIKRYAFPDKWKEMIIELSEPFFSK